MNKLSKLIILLVITSNFSCQVINNEEASSLYFKNENILNIIVKQMFEKKHYTYISIRKKSFLEKNFTLDFTDEITLRISKIDEQYNTVSFDTLSESIDFESFAQQYFIKAKINYSAEDTNILKEILEFMYKNNVTPISIKTPEYSNMTIGLSFDSALLYRIGETFPADVYKSYSIKDNWYYVTFK